MDQQYDKDLPVLYFLLDHHKFQQIVKIAFSLIVSRRVLYEYGDRSMITFSQKQEKSMQSDIKHFTLEQIIRLRGSHQKNVKNYKNLLLNETLLRKYKVQNIDSYTRFKLWLHCTEYYQRTNFYGNLENLSIYGEYASIIEKDLKRTNASYQTIQKCRQLLYSFAKYNPYIGYIQGMNDIAVFILEQQQNSFTVEQAFFIFKLITQEILPVDYYTNMKNIIAYLRIFFEMLRQIHPKSYLKIKQIIVLSEGHFVSMLSLIFQEFVCLFTRGKLNKQIVKVIWDFMMLEGLIALLKAGLVIYHYLQETILNCSCFQQYDYKVQCKVREISDLADFKKRMTEIQLNPRMIQILKNKILQQLQKEEQKTQKKIKKKQVKQKNMICQESQNYCVETFAENGRIGLAYEVLVFRTREEVNVIHDYLGKLDKQYFNQQKTGNLVDSLIIGRVPHTCRPKSDTITQSSMSQKTNPSDLQCQTFITPQKAHQSSHESTNSKISPQSQKTSEFSIKKFKEDELRKKAADKLTNSKKGMQRSDSTMFLESMVRNASISNLLDIYDLDEMFE